MIIFLYGIDSYRSRQKLNEIIEKYQAKHKTGLNFKWLDLKETELDILREAIETSSMFAEKKLIILENIFEQNIVSQTKLLDYLKKSSLKKDRETMIVVFEKSEPEKKSDLFKFLTGKDVMVQEFKELDRAKLEGWIKKEIEQKGGRIERNAVKKLAEELGGDLWQIANEIEKLVAYKGKDVIRIEDVDLFIKPKINLNIFNTIDALAKRDKKTALKLLHQHLTEGENEVYLLSMFIYQFRNLLGIKELAEKGYNHLQINQKTKLHPFIIKKSLLQIKNFNLEQLKKIYNRLLELDLAIKTGRIEPKIALDMLVMEV